MSAPNTMQSREKQTAPISFDLPLDIAVELVPHMDWDLLKAFSECSSLCNDLANSRLWRTIIFSFLWVKGPDRNVDYGLNTAFCDAITSFRRARHIRTVTMKPFHVPAPTIPKIAETLLKLPFLECLVDRTGMTRHSDHAKDIRDLISFLHSTAGPLALKHIKLPIAVRQGTVMEDFLFNQRDVEFLSCIHIPLPDRKLSEASLGEKYLPGGSHFDESNAWLNTVDVLPRLRAIEGDPYALALLVPSRPVHIVHVYGWYGANDMAVFAESLSRSAVPITELVFGINGPPQETETQSIAPLAMLPALQVLDFSGVENIRAAMVVELANLLPELRELRAVIGHTRYSNKEAFSVAARFLSPRVRFYTYIFGGGLWEIWKQTGEEDGEWQFSHFVGRERGMRPNRPISW